MRNIMKKSAGITIPYFIITTIAYALFTISFEQDNALGERLYTILDNENHYTIFSNNSSSQQVETSCKSPCPSTAEMCIQMCA